MNVNKETISGLYELIKECFVYNRLVDRMVSVLGVKFACNNSADLIHHGIAHYFPVLSDEIGERCLERYNIDVIYGATPAGDADYNSVEQILTDLEEYTISFQSMMMGVCKIALDHYDYQVFADLQDLLKDYNKIVEQTILLKDKIGIYGSNIASFDAHIKDHFWILGE